MNSNEQSKILLVGTERNCRSIGYVLDFKDYAMVEKLTPKSFAQYQDYQIYVCELKHKSKKLINRKLLKINLKLHYLDDILHQIDEEYSSERNQVSNDVSQTKITKKPIENETFKTIQSITVVDEKKSRIPLIKRIIRGMKHPLRSTWHVLLHIRWFIHRLTKKFSIKQKKYFLSIHEKIKSAIQDNKIKRLENKIKHYKCGPYKNRLQYIHYLCNLKPSELLLYVINAPINHQIRCTHLENITDAFVALNGDVFGCCHCYVPFGNIIEEDSNKIFNGIYSRIVMLSSLNQSYCLCPTNYCTLKCYQKTKESFKHINANNSNEIRKLSLGIDSSCNLACKSCNACNHIIDDNHHNTITTIINKLLDSYWLEKAKILIIAGMGEIFYSPYYRQLLKTNLKRKEITIHSNGLLFNETNWQLIADKYETINVKISVDAATPETYKKIRGGNFDILTKNLKMISELRSQDKIKSFKLCFVVQRDNFREMPAFVKMAQELNVDVIYFQRMYYWNWKNISEQEFIKEELIIKNKYF